MLATAQHAVACVDIPRFPETRGGSGGVIVEEDTNASNRGLDPRITWGAATCACARSFRGLNHASTCARSVSS
jgi:hypothetical protein